MEHQAKVAWLCSAFANNFPDFFGRYSMVNEIQTLNAWELLVIALSHDIGEIVVGDIPDDGSADDFFKDQAEQKVFNELIKCYSPAKRDELLRGFSQFQSRDSTAGLALYGLDKLEALLTQIVLAEKGLFGSLFNQDYISEANRYYMSLTDSTSPIEVWAAHMKAHLLEAPEAVKKPIFTLFEVALKELTGDLPEWWRWSFVTFEDSDKY